MYCVISYSNDNPISINTHLQNFLMLHKKKIIESTFVAISHLVNQALCYQPGVFKNLYLIFYNQPMFGPSVSGHILRVSENVFLRVSVS